MEVIAVNNKLSQGGNNDTDNLFHFKNKLVIDTRKSYSGNFFLDFVL